VENFLVCRADIYAICQKSAETTLLPAVHHAVAAWNLDSSGIVRLCRSEPQVRSHLKEILARRVNQHDQPLAAMALVEEYLDGPEYSVEMFSTAGVARCIGITAKSVIGDPYFVEAGHIYPAGLDPDTSRLLITTVRRALSTVGVREGPTHTEVKLLTDRAAIVEINATLARDPWTQSGMLEIEDIQPWTILLEANKEA